MGKMLVLVGFMFMAACADPGKSGEASVCSGTFVLNYNELLKRGKVSVEDAKRLDELFPAANAEVKLSAEEIKAKATALNESGWAEVIRRSANETLAICEKMFRSHGEKFACQGKTDKGWLESATADEVRSKVCNPSKLSLKRLDDLKTLAQ